MATQLPNIERVQENVRRMQAQNATEADLVGYLKAEGYTPTRFEAAVASAKKVGGPPVEAGFGRSLMQGLTFNTADEIEAAFRAGAISGPEYQNQLSRVRAGIKQYEEQYPGRAFTGADAEVIAGGWQVVPVDRLLNGVVQGVRIAPEQIPGSIAPDCTHPPATVPARCCFNVHPHDFNRCRRHDRSPCLWLCRLDQTLTAFDYSLF